MIEKQGCVVLVVLALILALAAPLILTDALNRRTQANQVKIAEAQAEMQAARERQAYYDAVAEQARVEALRAEGEREVLLASARAVDGNTEVVLLLAEDYFAMSRAARRDPLDFLPWAITAGVVLGALLTRVDPGRLMRRRARERQVATIDGA